MRCISKNCNYFINRNNSISEGKYCCNLCKINGKHNIFCQKIQPVIQPVQSKKIIRKALLIGINYIEDKRNTLYGCINDVKNMKTKLDAIGCNEFRILTDENNSKNKPTRNNIINGLNWLTTNIYKGDFVFLHYSGHGGLASDRSGDEQLDSCIYPINNGVIERIIDDELRTIFVQKIPDGCKSFAVFDSCHSGTALDLKYNINAPEYGKIILTQNNYPNSNGSVIFLSGCRDDQTAMDTFDKNSVPSGALTNSLLEVWNMYGTDIRFKYLLWDIRNELKNNGYSQVPQISCSKYIDVNSEFSFV